MNKVTYINQQIASVQHRINAQQLIVDSVPGDDNKMTGLIYERQYQAEYTILEGLLDAYRQLQAIKTNILQGIYNEQ